jgi:predicted ribosome quality control (RQC) complex YloA/Tae2 family protein
MDETARRLKLGPGLFSFLAHEHGVSLQPAELLVVAAALGKALAGSVVQKIGGPDPLRVELELRSPGRTARLVVSAEAGLSRISIAEARSPSAGPPSPWLSRLRKELVGFRLVAIAATGAREAELRFERPGAARTLVLEVGAKGALLLLGDERQPLAAASERARAARPPTPMPEQATLGRVVAVPDALELGRTVEARFSAQQSVVRAASVRRQRVQPLKTRVERLRRTLEKVGAEANRTEAAEEHRRYGELLRQNASAVPRGASLVTLTEYSPLGAASVEVPLDPALDARAQAERHFQRYRRLLRGNARATLRLAELQAELSVAETELAAVRDAPDADLLKEGPASRQSPAPPARRAPQATHQPYRVFLARSGERILVGRAGRDNDALTFGVARPDDVWLHARGIPGAHVVIPLPRGAQVPDETLVDAAHLALHHARGAGEDRGEVSYTRAKFVRRVKGGAPGAVTYTREKTFLVRLQPERLERLLASKEKR